MAVQWQNGSSLNMFPKLSISDLCNKSCRNFKFICKILKSKIFSQGLSNGQNFMLFEAASSAFLSEKNRSSSFVFTIRHVVLPQKKMFWVYANGVIARMANEFIKYWAPMKFIGKSVCSEGFVFKVKSAISVFKFRSCPNPASLFSFYEFKKIFFFVHLEVF